MGEPGITTDWDYLLGFIQAVCNVLKYIVNIVAVKQFFSQNQKTEKSI